MQEANRFFDFANLREHIRIAKETGAPQFMWTQDPVLQQYRFCNIFREDDRTTRYFARTVREPLRHDPRVLIATIGWRWFNRIETCGRLSDAAWADADTRRMRLRLRDVDPVVTGAYVIKTPNGLSKLEGVLQCIDTANDHWAKHLILEMCELGDATLEAVHRELMEIPYLGRFMAYEVVTDLRHTYLLEDAPDINTWASAGPGAMRGLGWVMGDDPDLFRYGSKKAQEEANDMMRYLLQRSRRQWEYDRPWEMREVEHTLCEFDKFRRAQNGQRLKRRYGQD